MQQDPGGGNRGTATNVDITTIYYLIIYAAKFSFIDRPQYSPQKPAGKNHSKDIKVNTRTLPPTHNPSNKR